MSAYVQPLPEPPAEDVDQVVTQLRMAREMRAGAQDRLTRTRQMSDRGAALGHRDSMVLRVLEASRTHEVELWDHEVAELEARAHALGLIP